VRVQSTGGTAVAGTDFTAIDETVIFPVGANTATVPVTSVDHGPLAPARTIELSLSEPGDGLLLSAATVSVITLTAHGDTSTIGDSLSILDFENGGAGPAFPWGSSSTAQPVLSLVEDGSIPGAAAGNHALVATVTDIPTGGWGGFSDDIDAAANWSAYDGFSFGFLGTGSGKNLRYELKSGGANAGASTLFERSVVDDSVGWRLVKVAFADLPRRVSRPHPRASTRPPPMDSRSP
jgi:beta-glucosidase